MLATTPDDFDYNLFWLFRSLPFVRFFSLKWPPIHGLSGLQIPVLPVPPLLDQLLRYCLRFRAGNVATPMSGLKHIYIRNEPNIRFLFRLFLLPSVQTVSAGILSFDPSSCDGDLHRSPGVPWHTSSVEIVELFAGWFRESIEAFLGVCRGLTHIKLVWVFGRGPAFLRGALKRHAYSLKVLQICGISGMQPLHAFQGIGKLKSFVRLKKLWVSLPELLGFENRDDRGFQLQTRVRFLMEMLPPFLVELHIDGPVDEEDRDTMEAIKHVINYLESLKLLSMYRPKWHSYSYFELYECCQENGIDFLIHDYWTRRKSLRTGFPRPSGYEYWDPVDDW